MICIKVNITKEVCENEHELKAIYHRDGPVCLSLKGQNIMKLITKLYWYNSLVEKYHLFSNQLED